MPLQNRVDPFGVIRADPARGLFTGNRGVIHDPATKTLTRRRWTTKAWLVCVCAFRDRRRPVMGRNASSGNAGWTELFFLDEPTALAAGHRPCFHCRHAEAERFAALAAAPGYPPPRAAELDALLHRQRRAAGAASEPVAGADLGALPDGAFVAAAGLAWAKRGPRFLPWSFSGYGPPVPPQALPPGLALLTPALTRGVLQAGYRPVWHPSAGTS